MSSVSNARGAVVAVVTVIAALVGPTALAWACTAEPVIAITALVSSDGVVNAIPGGRAVVVAPGAEARLQVVNYADKAPGTVEVRWDALDGALIGQSSGLSVPVRIPATAPGVHHLTALFRGTDGKVLTKASTPVTVEGHGFPASRPAWDSSAHRRAGIGTSTLAGVLLLSIGLVAAFGGALVVVATSRRSRAGA